jgi:hypothetical protein
VDKLKIALDFVLHTHKGECNVLKVALDLICKEMDGSYIHRGG